MTSAMRFKPTCARSVTVSGAIRSAASGSGSSASRVWSERMRSSRAVARHRPRTAHRVGHRRARLKSLPCKPRHDVPAHRFLAAEQMRAAGDVEQQPVRRIETDQRRVAVAPVGNRDRACAGRRRDRRPRWRCADTLRAHRRAPCQTLSPSPSAASLTAASRSAPFTGSATTSASSCANRLPPACAASAGAGERPRINRSVISRRSHTDR